jgi:hypothetical protein
VDDNLSIKLNWPYFTNQTLVYQSFSRLECVVSSFVVRGDEMGQAANRR